jgi:hypothetical protein
MRRGAAVMLAAGLVCASAASAESFVLVYSEGSVIALSGGATVMRGARIDSDSPVRLGVADKAIFIAMSGNVVCLNGPYHGPVADGSLARGNGPIDALRALFENHSRAPAQGGCTR